MSSGLSPCAYLTIQNSSRERFFFTFYIDITRSILVVFNHHNMSCMGFDRTQYAYHESPCQGPATYFHFHFVKIFENLASPMHLPTSEKTSIHKIFQPHRRFILPSCREQSQSLSVELSATIHSTPMSCAWWWRPQWWWWVVDLFTILPLCYSLDIKQNQQ